MAQLELKFGKSVFTIRPTATVMTVVMLGALVWLGQWQVQRMFWKHELLQQIANRLNQPPVDVWQIPDAQSEEYRPITAVGSFQPGQELYMHAISTNGQDGYHVLAPLKLEKGGYVLVDRGWVPIDRREPDARPEGENFGMQRVTGWLRLPHRHWMQPKDYPVGNDWYGYDLKAMAERDGLPDFLPFVLEADGTENPGGYPIGGQTRVDLPNNHFIYAVIWFSLAFALLVIYLIQGFKRPPPPPEEIIRI